ncbi:Tripartite tricarboxylate transporter TctB family protein [Oscillibacter sp. PC13]|uniref:tripartite tricarboxylate transporter TctB family protein n=1 Tax=Oscillibacter sp. PC13 TaxID=1855299 RepID=UPI0008E0B9D7|nr:tripartite tricarboxylate transporter TctB family protein [Oscillibacter sp. PC13]SFP37429.1 Tripartite tricarboxylate transporter TctB family protein [Oscillibacter sp. PC13]
MENNTKKQPITANILMICIAVVMLLLIPSLIDNSATTDLLGPRFVPQMACCLILLPNLLQLINKLVSNRKLSQEVQAPTQTAKTPLPEFFKNVFKKYWTLVVVMALAFAATFVVDYLGYIITYCLLCAVMLLLFREKRWYFYLISFALVIAVYFGFSRFLYVPLPSIF